MANTPTNTAAGGDQADPTLDVLAQVFIDAFPVMNATEQQLALKLYALLSEGKAVSPDRLAESAHMPLTDAKTILESWPGVFYDDEDCIIGFWGLTVKKMDHRLKVNHNIVYTWCAWDTLFIPELLNSTAQVTSLCAPTGEEITLIVSPNSVESTASDELMVSFLIPEESALKENITASFCHYVYFFPSRAAGEQWITERPGAFLLSLEDAFVVGKKMNAVRYKQALN